MIRLKLFFIAFLAVAATCAISCTKDDEPAIIDEPSSGGNNDNDTISIMDHLSITVNGMEFTATLVDNESARVFAAMLPMTIDMSELNGNEKYYYLDSDLPTNSVRPGTIHAGDLMLYGSSCVVLFYDTFQSGYSYTRLGSIDNPAGLAAALGHGNATVTFAFQ